MLGATHMTTPRGKPFMPSHQPTHDRAAAARKAKTPWRRFPGAFKGKK